MGISCKYCGKSFENHIGVRTHEGMVHESNGAEKVSKALKGRTKDEWSDEHKRNHRKGLEGHTVSTKTRMKIGKANTGNTHDAETRRKISENMRDMSGEMNPFYGKSHTLETRRQISEIDRPSGEDHWWWKDGTSGSGYPDDFWFARKVARERDDFTCQLCGITEEECGRELDVHHRDSDKTNNELSNLLSLCRSCHSRAEGLGVGDATVEKMVDMVTREWE